MLELRNVLIQRGQWQKTYNLYFEAGKVTSIQGTSGVGKSALLMAIAGFETVYAGQIIWRGEDITQSSVEQRPVSILFQEYNLFEHISVEKNLEVGLHLKKTAKSYEAIGIAAQQLEVNGFWQRKPGELSGGQRQRVALLRTLLRPEPIVLLDEPFAELDENTRVLVGDWVKKTVLTQGKTVLLVTHQMDDVERWADASVRLT